MLYINNTLLESKSFPDGTPLMKLEELRLPANKPVIITWLYDNDAECMRLLFLTQHLKSKGYNDIILVMPYIPNARFDRVKEDTEVFTLKYFAEFINSMNFKKVYALDPHSYVSEALINNIVPVSPDAMIEDVLVDIPTDIKRDLVLFFPDEGAMKRYSNLATKYGFKCVFASKKRDWSTGEILGLELHGNEGCFLMGRHVLIIDDICSKGGTFYHSAKALKNAGVNNIYLYISHCENTVLTGDLYSSDLIDQIYTTNSIFRNEKDSDKRITIYNKIKVFNIRQFLSTFNITI